MSSICFYFQVHQPWRLKPGHAINTSGIKTAQRLEETIFDSGKNQEILKKVATKCYYPATKTLLGLIDEFKGEKRKFKVSYSLSGVFLDALEKFDPNLLDLFKQIAKSKCGEFLNETYYHSLSSFWGTGTDRPEFREQVKMHQECIKSLLGYKAKAFRNTELLYNNLIAKTVEDMGYKVMLAEGIERVLEGWKSPEYIYTPPENISKIKVLLRNYRLSDDVSYRFSARWSSAWPLTADKYAAWLSACQGETLNLFMDYETFGEHQWEDTGIFNFIRHLPREVLKYPHIDFATPSEVAQRYPARGTIDVHEYATISWADLERDASAWLGNSMQRFVFSELERIGKIVRQSGDPELIRIWRLLQTSDHLYYCCTKYWADGDVHKYFSPYGTPQNAFEGLVKSLTQLEYIAKLKIKSASKSPLIREPGLAAPAIEGIGDLING
ncbi:Glycosyl hydrolase family 57 [uncultured archaeon]|nr:Glycosyl hydrolase family 57 [uncultured archaeon]